MAKNILVTLGLGDRLNNLLLPTQEAFPAKTSDFVSHSEATLESFLTVTLSEGMAKDYRFYFYPGRKAPPSKKGKSESRVYMTRRAHFFMLATYMADLSACINAMFTQLRYAVFNSAYLNLVSDQERKKMLDTQARQFKVKASNDEYKKGLLKNFMSAVNSGRAHIIKPSERFKGGFDILYSGSPPYQGSKGSTLDFEACREGFEFNPNTRSDDYSDATEKGMFDNAVAQAAFKVGKELLAAIMADKSSYAAAESFKRKTRIIQPGKLIREQILKVVEGSKWGTVFLSELVDLLPEPEMELVKGLDPYFGILAVKEADDYAVKRMLSASETNAISPDQLTVSEDILAVYPKIGFSYVIHLPEELAQYITQTPKGKPIPLMPLNTWASIWSRALLRVPKSRSEGGKDEKINIKDVPRYIMSPSSTKELADKRQAMNFYTEKGRNNADSIYISNIGTLNFCPPSNMMSLDNAKEYERLMEEGLKLAFDAGTPLQASKTGITHPVFALASPEYGKKIPELKDKIKRYAGTFQAFSWDYNVILMTSTSDPDKLDAIKLVGAAKPDALNLADYLNKPFAQSMQKLFVRSTNAEGQRVTVADFGDPGGNLNEMLKTSPFLNTLDLYAYLLAEKAVPDFPALLAQAAKDLQLTKLDENPYEKGLYANTISNDLKHVNKNMTLFEQRGRDAYLENAVAIRYALDSALKDSQGRPGSNVARQAVKENIDVTEDNHFFSSQFYTLAEFKNVYNYLGGRIFYLMLKAMMEVDKKKLMVYNVGNPISIPTFRSIVTEVMPLATILAKYVPNSQAILEEADALSERNKRNQAITAADIHVPGSKASFEMFPHQIETHQFLRNAPRFAVLDISPGGGKTILGLSDIACLINAGLIKRPLVLAPNRLVRNWIEDMHKVTQGQWNLIPVTTDVYKRWGDERLTQLINGAPINTICVCSISVLLTNKFPVVMGTHVEFASQVLEFMKKFGFDYVILDESHKAKNPNRNTHKVIKQLFVSSTVAYARIATGTLIHNKLTDVVGQAALFNSQIFRTPEEYESENMERVGDTKVMKWRKDTPRRAREQLARHAAVITMKRKEWAFLLPVPIESFIPVSLEMPEEDGGNAHSLMYDVILTNMLELIEQDENIKRLLEGKSTEDEEDSDSEGEDDDDEESGGKEKNGEDDLDDDTLSELEAALGPYLARLDQMLMDPLGDEFGEIYFKGIRQENFVANKVRAVVERIKLSFTDYPWKKGNNYKIKDVCDYKGQRYVLMPPDGVKAMDINYGQTYESIKEPPTDSRWKKEARGKVLVVCRYIRSVNAVYRALPPDLKKLAARFHSDIKERDQNLEDFKSNPISRDRGIQIMIANEHAISEGFNLQICDRVIRAEAPWNPGEIDQTVSRAFRPDPSGKYSRENLYLDWILTNNTLEVAKMGRLISKMLSKAEFDEADNPLYDTINQSELPLIKMDIKRTLQTIRTIDHIRPYIDEYQHLVTIQATEFKHMRDTKPSTMMKIDQTPMMKGAKLLDFVPYVANLEIPDRNNYGLVRLPDAIADTDNTDFADIHQDKKALIGKYVHTDFGNGVIVSVNTSNRVLGMPDSARKVTSVAVQLAGSDEVLSFRPALVYLATNLTEKTIKQFAPKSMWMTDKDRKRLEKQRQEAERAAKRAEKKAKRDLDKETKDLEKLRKVEEARKEKQSGKKPPKEKPQPIEQELEEEENNNLELFPVVYNGYLALEANPEDDSIDMEAYGFKEFGDYAYVVIKDLKTFEAVRKALEKKFKIMPTSSKVLDKLEDAFETGRSKKFSADLAPMAEFPNFYTESHRMSKVDQVTGKPQLRVYPVILKGVLLLNVDLARNPVMRKLLNKAIPGTTVKFQEASGLHIQFFNKKTELAKKVKELKKEGFVVINDEEVTEALEDLAVKSIKAI